MNQQPDDSAVGARMREEWDARAKENAFYYVASSRDDWTPEEFYASGRESVQQLVMDDTEHVAPGRDPREMRVLEIGCGAGRMTRALGEQFGSVVGVDVSGEMVARARHATETMPHVLVCQTNGRDLSMLADQSIDFAFSFIVFQHIPDKAVVESYVREVARVLKPGCRFKFQVQGAWRSASEEADTWLGAYVSGLDIRAWAEKYGFSLVHSEGVGTQYFGLWFERGGPDESPVESEGVVRMLTLELEDARRRLEGEAGREERLLRAEVSSLRSSLDICGDELAQARKRVEELEGEVKRQAEEFAKANEALEDQAERLRQAMRVSETVESEKAEAQEWARSLDRELEATRAYLRLVYGSPAYRAGRRLGLAPGPLVDDDQSE